MVEKVDAIMWSTSIKGNWSEKPLPCSVTILVVYVAMDFVSASSQITAYLILIEASILNNMKNKKPARRSIICKKCGRKFSYKPFNKDYLPSTCKECQPQLTGN